MGVGAAVVVLAAAVVIVLASFAAGRRGSPVEVSGSATTAVVTGHIDSCNALGIYSAHAPRYSGGTIVVLRGVLASKQIGPSAYQDVFPTDVVTSQVVPSGRSFRFVLAPGDYVFHLTGYSVGGNAMSFFTKHLQAGQVVDQDMPNLCA